MDFNWQTNNEKHSSDIQWKIGKKANTHAQIWTEMNGKLKKNRKIKLIVMATNRETIEMCASARSAAHSDALLFRLLFATHWLLSARFVMSIFGINRYFLMTYGISFHRSFMFKSLQLNIALIYITAELEI